MKKNNLNEYILHYLENDKTNTALLLNGCWGVGKSYYIKNELIPYLKKNGLNAIVISLYGINDISVINKSIYFELRMPFCNKNHSELLSTGTLIAKSILKNFNINGMSFNISDDDLQKLYKSINLENQLLILEDVERCDIEKSTLLGYVNELTESDCAKVLLVANETEISKNEKERYIRSKEKTISDTIQFDNDIEQVVETIARDFNNKVINHLFNNKDFLETVINCVQDELSSNLRNFIFSLQKAIDIYEQISIEVYDDFLQCILIGIMNLVSKIKDDSFPKWDATGYVSTSLSSNKFPLMKFAYDYIRWQEFNFDDVSNAFKAYKSFKLLDTKNDDDDLNLLERYDIETEEQVLCSLKSLEQKLNDKNKINVYSYSKLAYFLICVGEIVEFDSTNACYLMLKNIKELAKTEKIDTDLFLMHTYGFDDKKIQQKYDSFLHELTDTLVEEMKKNNFTYNPEDLEDYYKEICRYKNKYISDHQFVSKFDINGIYKMLLISNAYQICGFRSILIAVYRNADNKQFIEKDIEYMNELYNLLDNSTSSNWDKIQLMQIRYLKENLKTFIQQLK